MATEGEEAEEEDGREKVSALIETQQHFERSWQKQKSLFLPPPSVFLSMVRPSAMLLRDGEEGYPGNSSAAGVCCKKTSIWQTPTVNVCRNERRVKGGSSVVLHSQVEGRKRALLLCTLGR